MTESTEYLMPFGKWKGDPIAMVPEGALRYYLGWDQLRPTTRAAIEAELARRAGGEPRPTSDDDEVPF